MFKPSIWGQGEKPITVCFRPTRAALRDSVKNKRTERRVDLYKRIRIILLR